MSRIAVIIESPASSWTPPVGVQTVDLIGLGWHIAHASHVRVDKIAAFTALQAAGLVWHTTTRTDDAGGMQILIDLLAEDIALVCRAVARGDITNQAGLAAITAYDAAMTQIEGLA